LLHRGRKLSLFIKDKNKIADYHFEFISTETTILLRDLKFCWIQTWK